MNVDKLPVPDNHWFNVLFSNTSRDTLFAFDGFDYKRVSYSPSEPQWVNKGSRPCVDHEIESNIHDDKQSGWDAIDRIDYEGMPGGPIIFDHGSNSIWQLRTWNGSLFKICLRTWDVIHFPELGSSIHAREKPMIQKTANIIHVVSCPTHAQFHHISFDTVSRTQRDQVVRLSDDLYRCGDEFNLDGLLHLESTNSLYLFGCRLNRSHNVLYRYSVENEKWSILKPSNLFSINTLFNYATYQAIKHSDDKTYILIMGGISDWFNFEHNMEIAVYDVAENSLRASSVKLPFVMGSHRSLSAVLTNQDSSLLVAVGYVRRLYAQNKLGNMHQVSDDVLQLLSKWIGFDYVHVITNEEEGGDDRKHYRLSIDQIIETFQ